MNSINERHAAIATIIAAHTSRAAAITTIVDYHDDPAAISSPTLIDALNTLTGEVDPDFADITATLEAIEGIDPDLGTDFALAADLCPLHCADPDICGDQHPIDAHTYDRAAANLRSMI